MRRRRRLRMIALGVLVALAIGLFFVLDIGSWQRLDLDKLNSVYATTILYDDQGKEYAVLYNTVNRVPVSLDQIPKYVQQAFLAAEDKRFYSHLGIDLHRIGGAILSNVKSGDYSEGASTITQQLIKLTHLSSVKTLARKANEACLALLLERRMSKDAILEKYLNLVNLGKGAYGVEAAARAYFNKSASQLTLAEGALLAAIVKAPSNYAPHLHPDNALKRRNLVLNEMAEDGYITPDQAEAAKAEPITLAQSDNSSGGYGWYVDNVLEEAKQALGVTADEVLVGGYRIYTSFNRDLQASADALFTQSERFPKDASDGTAVQAALASIDVKTGEIQCLVGGREYATRRGLNRATQMKRQPGSAFKPISVYAAAIDQMHMGPTSFVDDAKRDFGGGYTPENASGTYYGEVTLRQALARSMNAAAVDLITRTGISAARRYAELAGIELDARDDNLSLALGSLTYGVTPASLVAAYAPLANGGAAVRAHSIRRIESIDGENLYQYQAPTDRVMSRQSACMITSMLRSAAEWGTAKELKQVGFPVAGKTGTVGFEAGGNRDAWTVAYTPKLATVVWMGFDNPDKSHSLSNDVGGGSYPARLAAAFLRAAAPVASGGDFAVPDGISSVLIDNFALTSQHALALASAQTPKDQVLQELFYDGQAPTNVSALWDTPNQVVDLVALPNESGAPIVQFTALNAGVSYLVYRVEEGSNIQIATLSGVPGQTLSTVDAQADPTAMHRYVVVPRHDGFYAEGTVVEGPASAVAEFTPEQRRLIDWIFGGEPSPTPLPSPGTAKPLFG